ncbi:hypothetical protein AOQ84DRAFT_382594 [Glonium stellatum]|uniref:Uncharacterized protein n=1 Tax=Glonium stellatum TaxID=574774 RepID=A0A8E2EPS2_9PEZI|nr:hypothetical protein AOQ84DRAFT_382594 [Glonium stellatum]
MSTPEQDILAQAQPDETLSALEVPEEGIPDEKSDIEIDPDAPDSTRRFSKGDTVHMTIIANGARTKGIFTISGCRVNNSKRYWEYKLKDSKGYPYSGGVYVREKDLKLERRRG